MKLELLGNAKLANGSTSAVEEDAKSVEEKSFIRPKKGRRVNQKKSENLSLSEIEQVETFSEVSVPQEPSQYLKYKPLSLPVPLLFFVLLFILVIRIITPAKKM